MRWPWTRPETRSAATYTDAVIDALASGAQGGGPAAKPSTTAAVEAAAGLVARAFASAKVTPETPAITPLVLSTIGRELVRRGECLYLIDVDADGLRLLPVTSWDIEGGPDPASWRYRVDVAGPSQDAAYVAPYAAVIHVRAYAEPSAPWKGVAPLQAAASTARLLAETEKALADESAGTRGHLLPVPQGPDDDDTDDDADTPLAGLKRDVANLKGRTAIVETTSSGWGDGRGAAPQSDWKPQRIGANPPEALRALRLDSELSILGSIGVPIELIASRSDGAAIREAWRRFAHAYLSPVGQLVAAELADKLDTPNLTLDFSSLYASDVTGRARAFNSMVQGGMPVEKAAALSGLLAGE